MQIRVHTETLPQAANAWAKLLPRFESILTESFGLSSISVLPTDLATQAALSAVTDWPNIYATRYNQRETRAEKLVTTCHGSSQAFSGADQSGANRIKIITPDTPGPAAGPAVPPTLV